MKARDVEMASIKDASAFHLDAWPSERSFPLSDAECAALCRGNLVRWHGSIDDMLDLPGRFELIDGWLMLRR